MAAPRAFISFEMEDRWARDFLVQHAKDKNNAIEFSDYSVKDPFDSNTAACSPVTSTSKSEAVLWEIAETNRQGHYIFGVQINRDKVHPVPAGLPSQNVIRWDFEQLVAWLGTWV